MYIVMTILCLAIHNGLNKPVKEGIQMITQTTASIINISGRKTATDLLLNAHKHLKKSKRLACEAALLAAEAEIQTSRCQISTITANSQVLTAASRNNVASAVKPWFELAEMNDDLAAAWANETLKHLEEARAYCKALRAKILAQAIGSVVEREIPDVPVKEKELVRV
jgi:hypothetical protein